MLLIVASCTWRNTLQEFQCPMGDDCCQVKKTKESSTSEVQTNHNQKNDPIVLCLSLAILSTCKIYRVFIMSAVYRHEVTSSHVGGKM